MLRAEDFFDLKDNPFKALFDNTEFVWDGLKNIKSFIKERIQPNVADIRRGDCFIRETVVLYDGKAIRQGFEIDESGKRIVVKIDGKTLPGASVIYAGVFLMDDAISIGRGTVLEPGALIKGPMIIGDDTEVRQGAYCRGDVLVGNNCVVGHTSELKSCVMLGGSKAGHFAYIGDSILGNVNLGAGTKLANLKIIESKIVLGINGQKYETGLRKFGAILADGVETGCNSVTTPGSLLSKDVLLYPNTTARGFYPPRMIVKISANLEIKERR